MIKVNKKLFPQLNPQNRAEQKRSHWFVELPAGTTLEAVLNPAMWANSRNLGRFDLVEIVTADAQIDVVLRVVSVIGGMPLLRIYSNASPEPGAAIGDVVEFLPGRGWRAVVDGEALEELFGTREAAQSAVAVIRGEAA